MRISNIHSVNGHKYRDIEELKPCNEYGDYEWDWIGRDVLTPNCGWKPDGTYCTKLCDKCAIAEELKELIGVE